MDFYNDCLKIISCIKPYFDQYNEKIKMPFVKNIINYNNLISSNDQIILSNDQIISSNNNEILIQLFDHYTKIYDIIEETKSKKHQQVHNIIKIIKEFDFNNVHEICYGNSILGNEIMKNKKIELYGYDINESLLEKNKKNIKGIFIKKDLLHENVQFTNNKMELITCLHGCGQLHRNLIDNIIKQKYNGKLMIIPDQKSI
jgi:predicted TPR repeat methyltransferase